MSSAQTWPPGANPAVLFANYTQRPKQGADALWMVLRTVVLALSLGVVWLLFTQPSLGLTLFWTMTVPLLPALWAIAPGLWRQVCPMAFLNQLPRMLGRAQTLALPGAARYWSYVIAAALLMAMVALRRPLLNDDGWATGAMCAAALGLAFIGGLLFKGRSGWCGTFCPLSPVQRAHGQAPIYVVRNGYCPTCVGCQKNCLDFNPRAAIHSDLAEPDSRHATQRLWFMAMLPGLIVGYYTLGPVLEPQGLGLYLTSLAAGMCASAGLFMLLRSVFATSTYRLASVFGAAALVAYYFWAGPLWLGGAGSLTGWHADGWVMEASRLVGVVVVLGVWRASLAGERAYQALERADAVRIDTSRLQTARRSAGGGAGEASGAGGAPGAPAPIEILERRSGRRFAAAPGKTLLDSMQAAGVPIDFGCRSGLCGADPVGIVEGHEHLNEPGADEAATLKRLNLTGRARMACCARARGPVTIDCEAASVPLSPEAEAEAEAKMIGKSLAVHRGTAPRDAAQACGVARVVIVGNGVAGITAAETLRELSPSVLIDVVAGEPLPFYNRMALGRVVAHEQALRSLQLLPEAWYRDHRIQVHLNAVAVGINRGVRCVHLSSGESLPYDRLLLATGARAATPSPRFRECSNAFVLRSAAHAEALHAAATARGVHHAVVIGGGVLGIEAAEALRALGLKVTIAHRGPRLMERQLDAEGAQRLAGYLENHGISVLTGVKAEHFQIEGGRLVAMQLAGGERMAGDIFVACAGVKPNIALAREAGLAVGRGVRVDARMATNDPMIFAAGDAADPAPSQAIALPDVAAPAGLWTVAVQQARSAAAAMLSEPAADSAPAARSPATPTTPATPAPPIVMQLKSEGIDLRSFGDIHHLPDDAEVLCAHSAELAWWRIAVRGGRAMAAVYVGPPGSAEELTRALSETADFSPWLPALRQRQLTLGAAR